MQFREVGYQIHTGVGNQKMRAKAARQAEVISKDHQYVAPKNLEEEKNNQISFLCYIIIEF